MTNVTKYQLANKQFVKGESIDKCELQKMVGNLNNYFAWFKRNHSGWRPLQCADGNYRLQFDQDDLNFLADRFVPRTRGYAKSTVGILQKHLELTGNTNYAGLLETVRRVANESYTIHQYIADYPKSQQQTPLTIGQ